MGDVLPFPARKLREPAAVVLRCRCAISRGRFVAEPGCPIHGESFAIDAVSVRPLPRGAA